VRIYLRYHTVEYIRLSDTIHTVEYVRLLDTLPYTHLHIAQMQVEVVRARAGIEISQNKFYSCFVHYTHE